MSSNELLIMALQSSEAEKKEQQAQFAEERALFAEERALFAEERAQLVESNRSKEERIQQLERFIRLQQQRIQNPPKRENKRWTKEEEKILLEKYEELGADIRSKEEEDMHVIIARFINKTPRQIKRKIYQGTGNFGDELKKIIEKVRTKMFMKMREDN